MTSRLISRGCVAVLVALLCALTMQLVRAQGPDLGTEAQRESGKKLYLNYCSQCHGEKGDGEGYATPHLLPKPRNFTTGKFKVRSTPTGALPTHQDLVSIIRRGMPYTSMPAWPNLADQEVSDLAHFIKSFSADFSNPEIVPKPVPLPSAPNASKESIELGRKLYEETGCIKCHGTLGRGDGPSAPALKDDWGYPIRAADLSQSWTFRGGSSREDIFRTMTTGFNGTPMPGFLDALTPEQRWAITDHIVSLSGSDGPRYSNLVVAKHVQDPIDVAKGTASFESAPVARFPIIGQIMEPGRAFHPSATSITVQAIYDAESIALLVRWHDMSAEKAGKNGPSLPVPPEEEEEAAVSPAGEGGGDAGAGGSVFGDAEVAPTPATQDPFAEAEAAPAATQSEFSDAVSVQIPSQVPTGARKPYFIFGDAQNSVDLWFFDLARPDPLQFTGRGSADIAPNDTGDLAGVASYDQGEWSVIFKRPLRATSGAPFSPREFMPVALSVWDGAARERGNRRGITVWYSLYVEPEVVPSPVGPMIRTALFILAIELAVIGWVRWRRRREDSAVPAFAPEALWPVRRSFIRLRAERYGETSTKLEERSRGGGGSDHTTAGHERLSCRDNPEDPMYKSIYVPVDNSDHSNRAVACAVGLGKAYSSKLVGCHVYAAKLHDYRFRQMEYTLPEEYIDEVELERQRKIHDSLITMGLKLISDSYLDGMSRLCGESGLPFEPRMMDGKHHGEILKDLAGSQHDLVVIGALGIGRARDSVIGSVCERVARQSDRDVWVVKHVPEPGEAERDTILVGMDGSPQSFGALMTAVDLARTFGKKVEAIAVYDPYLHYSVFNGIVNVLTEQAAKVFRFEEQNQLHEEIIDTGLAQIYQSHLEVGERMASEAGVAIKKTLLDGKPFQKILDHARKTNPWLIVLGRIGVHSPKDETALGSNAENVLRAAPCDVLLSTRLEVPRLDVRAEETVRWTPEAEERMTHVPEQVKGIARTGVLRLALEKGHSVITNAVIDEAMDRFMPKSASAATQALAEAVALERAKSGPVSMCRACGVTATQSGAVRCTVCGATDFEVISQEMIERIAEVEGGLQEETTYDGRKLRWSEEARKGLWTMKNAYQRRRVKARVEKRARMMRLDAITLEFARQVIEEETGAPLEIAVSSPNLRRASLAEASAEASGSGSGSEPKLIARDERKNPLISTFEWTNEAAQRIFRVPVGFMRSKTQERIEELARERAATSIDLVLVEEGIEIGKQMMAQMIATYSTSPSTGASPGVATTARDSAGPSAAAAGAPAQETPDAGGGYLNEVRALTARPFDPSTSSGASRAMSRDDAQRRPEPRRGAKRVRTRSRALSAYRFCRTDDIGLLVGALNRCWAPYVPDEPQMTPAAFKRTIRDLQVWCSSCMVAFSGSDPIGVLIGAKRPSGTLVHTIAVHPDHRRQGHGRHLLTSLSSKLAILGPPRIVAEVPETFAPACELFGGCGYVQEALLTDYVLQPEQNDVPQVDLEGRFVIPVTVDDLAANGLFEDHPPVCWARSFETLMARKDEIAGLAVASDERIEACLLYQAGPTAEILSLRTFVDDAGVRLKQLLSRLSAQGMRAFRFPKVHPAEFSKQFLETLGFRPAGRHVLYAASARPA